jgi:hypothetical protein
MRLSSTARASRSLSVKSIMAAHPHGLKHNPGPDAPKSSLEASVDRASIIATAAISAHTVRGFRRVPGMVRGRRGASCNGYWPRVPLPSVCRSLTLATPGPAPNDSGRVDPRPKSEHPRASLGRNSREIDLPNLFGTLPAHTRRIARQPRSKPAAGSEVVVSIEPQAAQIDCRKRRHHSDYA